MDDFWKIRAKAYNELQWVKDPKQLKALLEFADLKPTDIALDGGCGTGIVANAMVGEVSKVVAVDASKDMLAKAKFKKGIASKCWDLEDTPFAKGYFSKIVCRMVFHHLARPKKAFSNCHIMLDEGGWLVIQEGGIIPKEDKRLIRWYKGMMSFKEERLCFTVEDLWRYFLNTGFTNIKKKIIVDRNFSINNWLEKSGLSKEKIVKIYNLHYNASQYVKDAYKMRINPDNLIMDLPEIKVDSRILLIKGKK